MDDERKKLIKKLTKIMESELGKDKVFFDKYNPILEKMTLEELKDELKLVEKESKE
jgi:hypothetical protein